MTRHHLALAAVLLTAATAAAGPPTYWADVRPILSRDCTGCHRARNLEDRDVSGGLALDTLAVVREYGPKLLTRLRHSDPKKRMPLEGDPLPDSAVDTLRRWYAAESPEGERAGPRAEQPLERPSLPVTVAFRAELDDPLALTVPVGPLAPVTAAAFSPDGSVLAVARHGRVTLWAWPDAEPTRILTEGLDAVHDLSFRADGRLLAVAGGSAAESGGVHIFDVRDGRLLRHLTGHADVACAVAFSPDGTRVVSAGHDRTVRGWDVSTGRQIWQSRDHSDTVRDLAFLPGGGTVVSGGKDAAVRYFDPKTGRMTRALAGLDREVRAVAASPDGRRLLVSGDDSTVGWWDAATGEKQFRRVGHDFAVHEMAFDRAGTLLVTAGGDSTLRLWDGRDGTHRRSIRLPALAYAAAVSPDGSRAVAGCADGFARVFETKTGTELVRLTASGRSDWLAATPAGWLACSDGFRNSGRWNTPEADAVWKTLRNPRELRAVAAGESPTPVRFK